MSDDDETLLNLQDEKQSTASNTKTKTKRQRKPQTEEEYAFQLSQWESTGPTINTDTWLFEDLHKLDIDLKIDRVKLLHAVELSYYQRDYKKCLELIQRGEELYDVNLDEVGECITNDFKNSEKKVKWNKKLEKNIMELYNIKKKCIQKINI